MFQEKFINDSRIGELKEQLVQHPIYNLLTDVKKINVFMEHHVFAVWDFMSLVKSLQSQLTGMSLPWLPCPDADAVRLINEIVLGEESDELPDGSFLSHFSLYLRAMKECAANTETIDRFLNSLKENTAVATALEQAEVPPTAKTFVTHTFDILNQKGTHVQASALLFGREDLIPKMFHHLLLNLKQSGASCDLLIYYVKRHIEVDGELHGILSENLLKRLCANDPVKIDEAYQVAINTLEARVVFWDGIAVELKNSEGTNRFHHFKRWFQAKIN